MNATRPALPVNDEEVQKYYTVFIRTRGSFFAQNLRTIPASAVEESLKF